MKIPEIRRSELVPDETLFKQLREADRFLSGEFFN
jgi:hypothetical protein